MKLKDLVRWATTEQQLAVWNQTIPIQSYPGREPSVQIDLLWKEPPFQIERIKVAPFTSVPDHNHPNVDSWEYALKGGGFLHVGARSADIKRIEGRYRYIPRNINHGGKSYGEGALWLSIQRWYGPVNSVLSDWEEVI